MREGQAEADHRAIEDKAVMERAANEAERAAAVAKSEAERLAAEEREKFQRREQEATGEQRRVAKESAANIANATETFDMVVSEVFRTVATMEFSRNAQEASSGTDMVSKNVAGVSDPTAITGTAVSQLMSAASELSQQSETLKEEVQSFLGNIRAAQA